MLGLRGQLPVDVFVLNDPLEALGGQDAHAVELLSEVQPVGRRVDQARDHLDLNRLVRHVVVVEVRALELLQHVAGREAHHNAFALLLELLHAGEDLPGRSNGHDPLVLLPLHSEALGPDVLHGADSDVRRDARLLAGRGVHLRDTGDLVDELLHDVLPLDRGLPHRLRRAVLRVLGALGHLDGHAGLVALKRRLVAAVLAVVGPHVRPEPLGIAPPLKRGVVLGDEGSGDVDEGRAKRPHEPRLPNDELERGELARPLLALREVDVADHHAVRPGLLVRERHAPSLGHADLAGLVAHGALAEAADVVVRDRGGRHDGLLRALHASEPLEQLEPVVAVVVEPVERHARAGFVRVHHELPWENAIDGHPPALLVGPELQDPNVGDARIAEGHEPDGVPVVVVTLPCEHGGLDEPLLLLRLTLDAPIGLGGAERRLGPLLAGNLGYRRGDERPGQVDPVDVPVLGRVAVGVVVRAGVQLSERPGLVHAQVAERSLAALVLLRAVGVDRGNDAARALLSLELVPKLRRRFVGQRMCAALHYQASQA